VTGKKTERRWILAGNKRWIIALLLPALTAAGIFFLLRGGGSGQVLDFRSKQPIAGATLTLGCQKSNLIHGSRLLREVTTTSDAGGRYEFPRGTTNGCSYVVLHASKTGYEELEGTGLAITMGFGSSVPKFAHLVAHHDLVPLKLDQYLSNSRAERISPKGPYPEADYSTVAIPFEESKAIATSAAQVAWVRAHYCDRLKVLYAALNDQERARVSRVSNNGDYENGVGLYCAPKGTLGVFTDVDGPPGTSTRPGLDFDAATDRYILHANTFASRTARGDLSIAARVEAPTAGIMIRQARDPEAAFASALIREDGHPWLQVREARGGAVRQWRCLGASARQLKLVRRGTFVYLSTAGAQGKFLGSGCGARVALDDEVLLGIVAGVLRGNAPAAVTFSQVVLDAGSHFGAGVALELLARDTLERRVLAHPFDAGGTPWFSSDGSAVCFHNATGSTVQIDLLNPDAPPGTASRCGPAPVPNDARPYWDHEVAGTAVNIVRSEYLGAARQLAWHDGYANRNPGASPDGRFVAFNSSVPNGPQFHPADRGDYLLRELALPAGLPRELARFYSPEYGPRPPVYSPDGSQLLFLSSAPN
jgi:hypothetical protein